MKVEELEYFKKGRHFKDLELVKKIKTYCDINDKDKREFDQKIQKKHKDDFEYQNQLSDFISELMAFNDLIKRGLEPHWVPESSIKNKLEAPDIYYTQGGVNTLVEVKTINRPDLSNQKKEEESITRKELQEFLQQKKLALVSNKVDPELQKKWQKTENWLAVNVSGAERSILQSGVNPVPESTPNPDYFEKLKNNKLDGDLKKAIDQIRSYIAKHDEVSFSKVHVGEIYLYFYPSFEAQLTDSDKNQKTGDRVREEYAKNILSDNIKLFFFDFSDEYKEVLTIKDPNYKRFCEELSK